MAAELQADYVTGKSVYFLVRNTTGSIWNGTSFVAYSSVNLSTYAIAGTEQGTSGYFTATMPASVTAGLYYVLAKNQSGASAAEADLTIAAGPVQWDGANVLSLVGMLINSLANIEGAAAKLSPVTAFLKLVAKFDVGTAGTATIYRTTGAAHATQAVTTNTNLKPTQTLGPAA